MSFLERKARLLKLLERGLILQSEAAGLAQVSRQAVHQWVFRAGIDPERARRRKLRELMQ